MESMTARQAADGTVFCFVMNWTREARSVNLPYPMKDYETGKAILKLLSDTGRKTGMTVIIITHNSALTAMADRVVRMRNGRMYEVTINRHPAHATDLVW